LKENGEVPGIETPDPTISGIKKITTPPPRGPVVANSGGKKERSAAGRKKGATPGVKRWCKTNSGFGDGWFAGQFPKRTREREHKPKKNDRWGRSKKRKKKKDDSKPKCDSMDPGRTPT